VQKQQNARNKMLDLVKGASPQNRRPQNSIWRGTTSIARGGREADDWVTWKVSCYQ